MPSRSMLPMGARERLEVKLIGKPAAGELPVRVDEGGPDGGRGTALHGHEAGNGGYSHGLA